MFLIDLHEAISQIKATNENQKGKIIDVIELGYKLGEKQFDIQKLLLDNKMKEDYYDILGISKNASESEIKRPTEKRRLNFTR